MASVFVDIDVACKPVGNDHPISVDVIIGDGQRGTYEIFLGSDLKGSNVSATLGTGAHVRGKRTLVSVTIPDTLKETNWTSVTVRLTEDTKTESFSFKKLVPAHMDTAIYSINIFH